VIRLGVGLLLGFAAVELFHLTGILRTLVLFDSAMPAAVNTTLLAMKYDNESELVSSVVFLTTIASLVMIPFLVWMLG
jgi:malate permease and related proteins